MRALFVIFWCLPAIAGWSHAFNGDWQCISYFQDITRMNHDLPGDTESFAAIENLQINGNAMYVFEYPCQYLGTNVLYQSKGQWMYKDEDNQIKFVSIKHDTLTISDEPPFGTRTKIFIRDTLDPKMVQSLIAGKINPSCVAGDWHVVYSENCCYGSFLQYEYPYDVQDTIHLDSVITSACYSSGIYVVIKVDGVYQKCSVDCSYDFVVQREALRLTPINSKKGKTSILYRRCEEY